MTPDPAEAPCWPGLPFSNSIHRAAPPAPPRWRPVRIKWSRGILWFGGWQDNEVIISKLQSKYKRNINLSPYWLLSRKSNWLLKTNECYQFLVKYLMCIGSAIIIFVIQSSSSWNVHPKKHLKIEFVSTSNQSYLSPSLYLSYFYPALKATTIPHLEFCDKTWQYEPAELILFISLLYPRLSGYSFSEVRVLTETTMKRILQIVGKRGRPFQIRLWHASQKQFLKNNFHVQQTLHFFGV